MIQEERKARIRYIKAEAPAAKANEHEKFRSRTLFNTEANARYQAGLRWEATRKTHRDFLIRVHRNSSSGSDRKKL